MVLCSVSVFLKHCFLHIVCISHVLLVFVQPCIFAVVLCCRHPESKARPPFSDVLHLLSGPDEELLEWSEEDLSIHPLIATLGADISIGENLYTNLQVAYV